ncbi:MAG TPA: ABC transporter permease [Vicinamibacterales bacterium]|nr:ABC transporter permease [Vicinamibacterales bacterium]
MRWLTRLFRREQLERDLDRELRSHVEEETDRLIAEGVNRPEARRRALAAFGGFEPMKEHARDARGTRWLEDLTRDAAYALRLLRRSPAFALAAVGSLAIGIGANAAVFSVADALLLRALPVDHPEELYFINKAGIPSIRQAYSGPAYERFKAAVPDAGIAARGSLSRIQITNNGVNELALAELVSGNFFDVLGVPAAAGRVLSPADTTALGGAPVVTLSHAYWTRRYAASPTAIGSVIQVNGQPVTIVGIAASTFTGITVGSRVDMWLPMTMQQELRMRGNASMDDSDDSKPWLPQEGIQWLSLIARIPAHVDRNRVVTTIVETHRQAVARRAEEIQNAERRNVRLRERADIVPASRGTSGLRDSFASPLWVLLGTTAIVLLIGCANLASLLLARGSARAREFALRLSLGARRGRIVRQLLTESVVLAVLGGLAGMAVARWGSQALLRWASTSAIAIPLEVPLDWRFVGFVGGVSLLTGVIFGAMPALRLSRRELTDAMKAGGRVRGAEERRALPFGKLLIAAQVMLALTLLVGAMLFMRTFQNLLAVDPGYAREQLITARFDPRLAAFKEAELPALYERLLAAAASVPGAKSTTLSMNGPATNSIRSSGIQVQGRPQGTDDESREDYVALGYLQTMGIQLLRGRDFRPQDDARAPKVAIVNEAMARKFFGDADPIGKRIGYGEPFDVEIVGLMRDARFDGLRDRAQPLIVKLLAQAPDEYAANLYVRTSGDPAVARAALAQTLASAEPRMAIREVVSVEEMTERTVANERLVSRLTGAFGLLAVAVACLGLYGTVAYSVVRRTSEIGVRVALGATRGEILWMVVRETLVPVVAGIIAGVGLAMLVSRFVASLLYDLSPNDPSTLATSALVLMAMALLASLAPAIQAARLDPVRALRD